MAGMVNGMVKGMVKDITTILADRRTQPLTDILKDLLQETDETGTKYEEQVARTLMDIAAGRRGKPRDHILAAQMVFDRIDGKAKQEAAADFFASYPKKGTLADKYRIREDVNERITELPGQVVDITEADDGGDNKGVDSGPESGTVADESEREGS